MNTHRHALRQTHPLQIRDDSGHPFTVNGAAAVGHTRGHTVDRSVQHVIAAQGGNLDPVARTNAIQFRLFKIGQDIK
ncbi:hypothetical protein D3C71_1990710 [compost metagenome]